jgi:hypothetical protein
MQILMMPTTKVEVEVTYLKLSQVKYSKLLLLLPIPAASRKATGHREEPWVAGF